RTGTRRAELAAAGRARLDGEIADLVEHYAAAHFGAAVAEETSVEAGATSLADLDVAADLDRQADRRRTGRLVLADTIVVGETARAHRPLALIDPGPDAADVGAPGQ